MAKLARMDEPIGAVEELIWNGLDADAHHVAVEAELNDLGGIEVVRVVDDGHGMGNEECLTWFQGLGGSWKAKQRVSRSGRFLHGKAGHGRLRAFALGRHISWATVGEGVEGPATTRIESSRDAICDFEISQPAPVSAGLPLGTTFEATGGGTSLSKLTEPRAFHHLTAKLALYLEMYTDVEVSFLDEVLNPSTIQAGSYEFDVTVEGADVPARLRIIEWNKKINRRELHLCDDRGIPQATVPVRVQARGYDFTAYLTWPAFGDDPNDLLLIETNIESVEARLVEAARDRIREHFRDRAAERQTELVEGWKVLEVYPYSGPPANSIEEREREMFDAVASTVAEKLPKARSPKKVALGLLRHALAADPEFLRPAISELFALGDAERSDLIRLLNRTRLSSIIRASTTITNRLDFIAALEQMVLDPEARRTVLERSELHELLEGEPWVFGEEYALHASDRSLTEVLKRHLALLGRPPATQQPVRDADGRVTRIDLMLSRAGYLLNRRHHLIVELKRPSVEAGITEWNQVTGYADAVTSDDRFASSDVTWDFWLVATKIDRRLHNQVHQDHLPPGCGWSQGGVRIWARTWGEVIEECQRRLRFYQKALEYESSEMHALDYLLQSPADGVPDILRSRANQVPAQRTSDADAALPQAPTANDD
ncbi:ATP-binding protein [Catenulispora sp. NL8]|uniref:ATP-binding protein n=1 Tax=Catenulispora pinistramenti TaxID=2705254 RepID=A0ABS5KK24_9ACTN|nr:ATP-binding protein [Catenulispora pinistramenti]MBS2545481.1 ATP-binding protein [Catenulispora pinistramenti]